MLNQIFFHRTIVCGAISEMATIDATVTNSITASAVKNIPFKDKCNWGIVLLLLVSNVPLFAYLFFGNMLAATIGTSDNLVFIASFLSYMALLPICWSLMLRVARPKLLAILMQKKTA